MVERQQHYKIFQTPAASSVSHSYPSFQIHSVVVCHIESSCNRRSPFSVGNVFLSNQRWCIDKCLDPESTKSLQNDLACWHKQLGLCSICSQWGQRLCAFLCSCVLPYCCKCGSLYHYWCKLFQVEEYQSTEIGTLRYCIIWATLSLTKRVSFASSWRCGFGNVSKRSFCFRFNCFKNLGVL